MVRYILSLFLLLFFTLSSGSHASQIKLMAMPEPECGDYYSLINKVKIVQSEKHQLTIKLFETGGGDPSTNGNKIIIHLNQWDPDGNRYTWDTGINIYEVKAVELKNKEIIITCTEHIILENTTIIKTVQGNYSISYFLNKTGSIEPYIKIEKEIQGISD
jgi:hypothetical protein